MGILSAILQPSHAGVARLPTGSFTVDREGRIVSSTMAHSFPTARMQEIGRAVLDYFRNAHLAAMPVREVIVQYPSLRLSARELRGGAIVFLAPLTPGRN